MTVLSGHYYGRQILLDEPVPENIPADTPVQVTFASNAEESALDKIARLARPGGLPADFSEQHDHYVRGTPRK